MTKEEFVAKLAQAGKVTTDVHLLATCSRYR